MIYIINVVLSGMKLLFLYLKYIGMFLKALYPNKTDFVGHFKRVTSLFIDQNNNKYLNIFFKFMSIFPGKIY